MPTTGWSIWRPVSRAVSRASRRVPAASWRRSRNGGRGSAAGPRGQRRAGHSKPIDPRLRAVYVGLVTRAIALVIDAMLINVAALAVSGAALLVESIFARSSRHHALAIAVGGVLFFVWVVGYFAVFWTATGQTPGSRVMQIRVTRLDDGRLGWRRALVRLAWMVLSLPLFWNLPVLFTAPSPRGIRSPRRHRRHGCHAATGNGWRQPAPWPSRSGERD